MSAVSARRWGRSRGGRRSRRAGTLTGRRPLPHDDPCTPDSARLSLYRPLRGTRTGRRASTTPRGERRGRRRPRRAGSTEPGRSATRGANGALLPATITTVGAVIDRSSSSVRGATAGSRKGWFIWACSAIRMIRGSSSIGCRRASRRRTGPGAREPSSIGRPHSMNRPNRKGASPPLSMSVRDATRSGARAARPSASEAPVGRPHQVAALDPGGGQASRQPPGQSRRVLDHDPLLRCARRRRSCRSHTRHGPTRRST